MSVCKDCYHFYFQALKFLLSLKICLCNCFYKNVKTDNHDLFYVRCFKTHIVQIFLFFIHTLNSLLNAPQILPQTLTT